MFKPAPDAKPSFQKHIDKLQADFPGLNEAPLTPNDIFFKLGANFCLVVLAKMQSGQAISAVEHKGLLAVGLFKQDPFILNYRNVVSTVKQPSPGMRCGE